MDKHNLPTDFAQEVFGQLRSGNSQSFKYWLINFLLLFRPWSSAQVVSGCSPLLNFGNFRGNFFLALSYVSKRKKNKIK